MHIIHAILFALWFLLPAADANMAPIFAAHLPWLKRFDAPIDGGRTFHGKPLLGTHKTWRGLLAGMVVSTLIFWLQQVLLAHVGWLRPLAGGVDYAALPTFVLGPLFGLGALGGDAVKSFFKRRVGVESGKSWLPFDQLDYVIGGILVTLPFVRLAWTQYLTMLIVWFLMHLLFSYLGWLLHLKEAPV